MGKRREGWDEVFQTSRGGVGIEKTKKTTEGGFAKFSTEGKLRKVIKESSQAPSKNTEERGVVAHWREERGEAKKNTKRGERSTNSKRENNNKRKEDGEKEKGRLLSCGKKVYY